MKIISIFRKTFGLNLPEEFTIGKQVIINGNAVGPPVSTIKHWESRYNGNKAINGECYVVEFEDSTVKRIIPVGDVVEVVIETAKEDKLPDLPEKAAE